MVARAVADAETFITPATKEANEMRSRASWVLLGALICAGAPAGAQPAPPPMGGPGMMKPPKPGRYMPWREREPGQPFMLYGNDGQVVYVAGQGGKWAVVLDGRPGAWYDWVGNISLSPEGQGLAYVATREGKLMVVTGEQESPAYEQICPVRDRGWEFTNSPAGPLEPEPGAPFWTYDGKLVYAVARGAKRAVVIDGHEGLAYDRIGLPPAAGGADGPPPTEEVTFVAVGDGGHLIYMAQKEGKWVMVIDGKEGPAFDHIAVTPPEETYGEDWGPPPAGPPQAPRPRPGP